MSDADWDLFQSLHAVLKAGSLSAAARLRGLTQPTLGRHIEALEQQLGAPLFLRSARGLQPTEAAMGLRPHLEEMAAAAAATVREASGAALGEAGVVRVTTSEVMGVEVLPAIIAEFRLRQPGIDVELVLSNDIQDLSRRDADVAVRMGRPSQGALVARRVGAVGLGFYATAAYLARCGTPGSVDELLTHAVIGYDQRPPPMPAGLDLGRPITRDLFAFRSDSDAAQLAALRAGFGIGACQHQIGRRSGLVEVLPGVLSIELETWVVMHENLRANRRVRLMFDCLVDGLGAYVAEAR
jgi:DNA-binding transcriptional LysR family regulator